MCVSKTGIDIARVKRASQYYLTLLNMGLTRETALKLVSQKYYLTKSELMVLYRCIHPTIESYYRRRKLIPPHEVRGKVLAVDGFNVIITLQSVIEGIPVCISSDGLLRDIMKSYRKFSYNPTVHNKIIETMVKYISILLPRKAVIVYDKQVSYSGVVASVTNSIIRKVHIEGQALVREKTDKTILEVGEVVASSDVVIVNKASKVFDLAYYIVLKENLITKPNIHVMKMI
ncbi:MAG TPA: DUF434 domain-containing protein [Desulfurococcales archaeon]|nr:DUF434 domain-containing protein [Desulfurococcales archaeon]